MLVRNCYLL